MKVIGGEEVQELYNIRSEREKQEQKQKYDGIY